MANNRELSQLGSIIVVDDSNRNLGIGTTNPNAVVGSGNTAKLSVGIVSAYQFYGDASNLTGITPGQVGALANLIEDTTPQLGGDLDVNGNDIIGTGNINLSGVVTSTEFVGDLTGTATTATNADLINIQTQTLDDNVYYIPFESGVGHTSLYIDTALSYNPGQNLLTFTNVQGSNISLYDNFDVSGISTLGTVKISSGIITASSGIVTYYGDGSNLTGVTAAQVGALANLIEDTTPQLGGDLDVNGNDITGTGNVNLTGVITATSFSGNGASLTNVDADTLGGISSTSFLRSDVADTKTSGNLTFSDGVSARFGDGEDLIIWHNAADSYILQTGTGNLNIRNSNDDADVRIESDDGSGGSANYFLADGSTGEAILYHYGTQKLATKSTGIDVTGHTETDTLNVSGVSTFQNNIHLLDDDKLLLGGSAGTYDGLEIYHDGNHSYIDDSGTGNLYLRSGTLSVQNLAGSKTSAVFQSGSSQEFYFNNSKKLETTNTGIAITNGASTSATIAGPENLIIDPAAVGDNTGSVRIKGDLFVDGTQTIINSSTIELADFVVGIASTATTDALSDGAGIEIGLDNTFKYHYNSGTNPSLKSSENLNVASGKAYQIDQVEVLNATTLGSNVVNSSLTSLGTLTALAVSGVSTLGTVKISSGIITASSGIVTYYGDGTYLSNLAPAGAIEGLIVIDESGNTVGTSGSITTLSFEGSSGVTVTATSGPAGIATVVIGGFSPDAQENLYAGTGAGAASDADTCYNIALGCNAGNALNAGDKNVILGYEAGKYTTSGSNNIFLGCQTGMCNDDGSNNIFLGLKSGHKTTDNSCGIAIGFYAAACRNSNTGIFIGRYAGYGCVGATGACNIAIGSDAGKCGTLGSHNVFLGTYSGLQSTNCSYNTFAGYAAGRCSGSGYNVFFGAFAGQGSPTVSNNTGGCNIAIGPYTQCVITSGSRNVTLGENAGRNLNIGFSNVFLGASAGKCVTTGNQNIFLGNYSGCGTGDKTGQNNIGLGRFTGKLLTSGCYNIFFGYNAGDTTTSGCCNIAIGREVELPSATGNGQLAIGDGTNRWITGDSSFNVGFGTDVPSGAADSNNTQIVNAGIVTANFYYGDGSNLTNLPAAGFQPDAQENLYAGTSAGAASDSDTCFNIGIGYSAGASLNSGDENIFLGSYSGNSTTSGGHNVFLGRKAGANHTSGYYNIAIGNCANASGTTTGQHNVFIGCGAGDCVTSGCDNVYLGRGAGNDVTTARCNIALGFYAGSSNLAGLHNIFLGNNAGGNSSSGNNNINIGQRTGFCNAGGLNNNFIGYYAGFHNTTGCSNNYFGYAAGYCNCTGSANNFFGENAGFDFASGSKNIFIGYYSGKLQTSGDCNIAIGHNACFPNKTGSSQLAIGAGNTNWISGDNSFNVTIAGIATVTASTGVVEATKFCGDGSCLTGTGFSPDAQENLYAGTNAGASSDADTLHNIGIGWSAGASLNSGDNNVFLGRATGKNITSGCYNIAIGQNSNCNRTGGSDNITLGRCSGTALHPNNSSCNIFIGAYTSGAAGCQSNCAGCHNIGIGQCALYCAGRSDNIAIGRKAGGGLTSSGCNIAIGPLTLNNGPGGNCNIAIGCAAGKGANGINNVFLGHCTGYQSTWTYSENTIIGNCAGQNSYGSKNTFLGHLAGNTNTGGHRNVAIGYDVELPTASGSDQMAIGNCCGTWINGDSNFNVGIGTNTDAAVGAGNTAKLSVGIVSAYKLYGDGSNLINLPPAGFAPDDDKNLVAGTSAGAALDGTSGCYNVFLGCGAGQSTTSGASNIFLGCEAGKNATTSNNSIFLGRCAGGYATVTGDYNIAFGFGAGKKTTSGTSNIFVGNQTACNGTVTGSCNIALGYLAGYNIANGNRNLFIGQCAGHGNTSGGYNIAFGAYAASAGTLTGAGNITLGQSAGRNLAAGSCNIYIGAEAGCAHNTNSNNNVGMGKNALEQVLTAYSNIAIGDGAGQEAGNDGTTISTNVFIGQQAGRCARSSENVFIGKEAGRCTLSEGCNVFIGHFAGYENSSGGNSVYIGNSAGQCFVSGSNNVSIGLYAGQGGSTKSSNTAVDNVIIGREAGRKVTSGSYNVFMGQYAGCSNTTGCCNIYLGKDAARSLSAGQHNIIGGYQAGYSGSSAGYNVVLGYLAYTNLCTGSNNVAFGLMSGYCNCGGDDNVYIGTRVAYDGTDNSDNVFIGNQVACSGYLNQSCCNIAIGYQSVFGLTTGDNNISLGNQAGKGLTTGCYNIYFGKCTAAGGTATGNHNIAAGTLSGNSLSSGQYNIFFGSCAGKLTAGASHNIFLGRCAGCTNTSGTANIAIGKDVVLPSATGDAQFAIGCGTNRWIYGDSNFNIYDKDGNQLNGASSGGGGGLWSQTSVGIHTLSCVGIGTTNPQSKLEINVGTAVSAFDIQGSAGQLFSVTNNLTSGSIFSVNDVSGIPSIDVDADGTIQLAPFSTTEFVGVGTTNPTTKLHVIGEVTATDFNSTSDARLKTNVQVIDDPLAKVLQINGVSFNWIENNKSSMGVIADNIEEVLPELVSDTDPKTVNYNGLIGLLIEVVKEQQTQIDSLNERLSRLE